MLLAVTSPPYVWSITFRKEDILSPYVRAERCSATPAINEYLPEDVVAVQSVFAHLFLR